MKAIILAGGRGKRLAPHTAILPKPLIPIDDKPILEVVISQLAYYGFSNIVLAVGYQAELIEAYFGDGGKWGVEISYSKEEIPLGTAGPISLISELDETFLLLNSDILTDLDFKTLVYYHKKKGGIATIALYHKQVKLELGIVEADDDGVISNYIEKPSLPYEVSMGIYAFEPNIKDYIKEKMDIPDLINLLISSNERIYGYRHKGIWLDIGNVTDHQEAVRLFSQNPERFLKTRCQKSS